MPIYEFYCDDCDITREIQKPITRATEDIVYCTECGQLMRKIIGSPIAIFKGKGFYSTDYRGDD